MDVGEGALDLAIEAGAQLHLHPAMTLHRQPQPHHAVPVQALTRGEFRHQLAQPGAILGMEGLIQGMVEGLGGGLAGQGFPGWIEKLPATAVVAGEHHQRQVLDQLAIASLAVLQGLFGQLVAGDVDQGAASDAGFVEVALPVEPAPAALAVIEVRGEIQGALHVLQTLQHAAHMVAVIDAGAGGDGGEIQRIAALGLVQHHQGAFGTEQAAIVQQLPVAGIGQPLDEILGGALALQFFDEAFAIAGLAPQQAIEHQRQQTHEGEALQGVPQIHAVLVAEQQIQQPIAADHPEGAQQQINKGNARRRKRPHPGSSRPDRRCRVQFSIDRIKAQQFWSDHL